ncbi:MAG: zinc-dependent alcohol dehydrogenase family protein [Zetaproteobacteria bacterium]|nr:zinc-dependent alcohol dehydrogenase family protein [Zetaproteobacteria bacterium]
MRAVQIYECGSNDVLQFVEVAKPVVVGEHQVLVRVMAAGVNPIDTKLRSRGLCFDAAFPAVLGCDGAGIIESVGSLVDGFQVGDEVYYCFGGLGQENSGNYAEYTLVDVDYLAEKPKCLSFVEAAASPLVLITAWESLFDRGQLREGQRVLILGGAGGVGHVAIQLAKIAGAQVATTVSCDEKSAFATELGADCVINYKNDQVVDVVMAWSQGEGVDLIFDTVGGDALHESLAAIRFYGHVVTILQAPESLDWKSLRLKNVTFTQELMLTPMVYGLTDAALHQGDILDQCAQFFEAGQLSIFVDEVLPLQEAAKAHQKIEAGGMVGKIVLEIVADLSDEN